MIYIYEKFHLYDVLLGILERRFGKVITLNTKSRLLS